MKRTMGHNCGVVVINEGAEDRALSIVEGTSPRLMPAVEVTKDEYIGANPPGLLQDLWAHQAPGHGKGQTKHLADLVEHETLACDSNHGKFQASK
ncbi:hypothetical protein LAZ67_1001398 [Cordylochernes scorpioides]|uniref:Uncharacterized protein n=1 Tax=Cordylochernes scorpioides TaxID=51811 RepID=A0ABY6JW64_9ARAC|nr:hypothetical protein LAZ67_1001398 [Cordylochernes scorpioides]